MSAWGSTWQDGVANGVLGAAVGTYGTDGVRALVKLRQVRRATGRRPRRWVRAYVWSGPAILVTWLTVWSARVLWLVT